MTKTAISSGWKQVPLTELLKLNQSGIWGNEGGKEDYPVLRSSNIHNGKLILTDVAYRKIPPNKVADYELENGDILVTKSSGSSHLIGKSCIFRNFEKKCYLFSNFTQRLRTKKEVLLPEFLYYYLNSSFAKETLQRISNTTSGLRNLNMKEYGKQLIPVPPIPVQKKVAAILEKADAAREKRRQANQLTEQFLQSVFLEMFGNPATNPKGWEKKPFGDCIANIRYATGSPPPYVEQGIPFIRATNIKRGTVVSKDMKYISSEDAATIPKCKVQTGDLIIVRSGINAGDCGIIPNEYNGAYAAYDLIVNLPKASAVFFNHLLNSPFGKAVLTPLKRRAGQPHLNSEQITSLVFSVPPLSEQQKFAELVEKVDVLRTKQRQSEQELGNLFNSLMQRAFRGELVPQDPHDEPASELLKRIKEERVAREAKIETEKRRSKEKFLKNNIN